MEPGRAAALSGKRSDRYLRANAHRPDSVKNFEKLRLVQFFKSIYFVGCSAFPSCTAVALVDALGMSVFSHKTVAEHRPWVGKGGFNSDLNPPGFLGSL